MRPKKEKIPPERGAYILRFIIKKDLVLKVGSLGNVYLPAGRYAYVGSARRSIRSRIDRHRRLAEEKSGKRHWHIDYVLTHPATKLTRIESRSGSEECAVARDIASRRGVSVPVPRFGATDCRAGCKAHLFRIKTLEVDLSAEARKGVDGS